jgi:hypothetical protein
MLSYIILHRRSYCSSSSASSFVRGESGNFRAALFPVFDLGEYWVAGIDPSQLDTPSFCFWLCNGSVSHNPRTGLVLTLLHWREWNSLSNRAKIPILSAIVSSGVLTIVQIVAVSLKVNIATRTNLFGMVLLTVTAFLLIAWKWGSRYPVLLWYLPFFIWRSLTVRKWAHYPCHPSPCRDG